MDDLGCILIVVRNLETSWTNDYAKTLTANGYRIAYAAAGEDPVPLIRQHSPIATCFQFDYPDLPGLVDLRVTKQQLPSNPLLMITQAHSEQLAVWAFRMRVWDYFVQPVDTARLLDVVETLKTIREGRPANTARTALDLLNVIPPEARLRCSGVSEDQALMDQVQTYLNANLHKKIVQAEVAERFGLSPFQLSRLFKRLSQVTFQSYLAIRRIEEAKRLLANPKVSITDICFTVGFHDLSYFTRIFQRHVGLPPSRFRRSLTAKTGTTDVSIIPSAPKTQSTRTGIRASTP